MPRDIKTSFNAGEFSPRLYGRVDLAKFAAGCKTMINYLPMPHGGATRRSGFKHINTTKHNDKLSRVIPFQFSTEQAYIIEAGDLYMRFYMNGGQIQGVDSYTKLLLHFAGLEASQTFVDDGYHALTVAAHNNAQIDTSESVFTGSSGTFSKYAADDYISVADSDHWNYGTGAFTIDFRVKFRVASGMHCLYYQPDTTTTDHIALFYDFGSKRFYLLVMDAGAKVISQVLGSDSATALSTDRFYHIALIRGWDGDPYDWALVFNGAFSISFSLADTMPDHDQPIQIGGGVPLTKVFDFSPDHRPLTVGGNTTISTAQKKFGRGSIAFDGSGDYLSISDDPQLYLFMQDEFTVEAFVRHSSLGGYQTYFGQGAGTNNYMWFYYYAGWIRFRLRVGAVNVINIYGGQNVINLNTWHHVAAIRKNNHIGIYIDGMQVAHDTYSTLTSLSGDASIGRLPPSNAYWLNGFAQDVRICAGTPTGGNPHNAEPGTWPTVDTFTVPTKSPAPDSNTKVLIFGQPKNLDGWLDEYRISKGIARWTTTFSPPSFPYPAGDNSGAVYEIATTYTETELSNLKWAQSADILYIVSPDRMPRKLSRTSHTNWTINDLTFDADNWPPFLDKNTSTITLTPSGTTGSITLTAANGSPFNSSQVGGWFALHNGYVKVTAFTDPTHVDATVVKTLVDTAATTNWWESAWSDYRGWPTSVTFYEDRLCFAGPAGSPDRIDLSVTRDYENFYRAEFDGGTAAADNAMVIYLSSRQINAVRWLAGTRKLIAGTSGGEWWMDGGGTDDPLSATDVPRRRMDTEHGSANINSVLIGSRVLFVQRLSRKLREFFYDWQNDVYQANDITVLSEHLTNRAVIEEVVWQQSPHQLLWAKRSDGLLMALTYMREHEVVGWSRHPIGGTLAKVESIAVIEGATEDELWAVVQRTINGGVKRYIERMEPLVVINTGEGGATDWDLVDAFFVDSGLTYRGAPTTALSGLDHLEGEAVVALADGVAVTGLTVSGGAITLPTAASVVHVGLNFNSDVEGLWPINQDQDGLTMGYPQRLANVVLLLYKSLGGKIGPNEYKLTDIQYPTEVTVGADERITRGGDRRIVRGGDVRIKRGAGTSAPDFYTGLTVDMSLKGGHHCYPTVYIRQDVPLPLTITAIIADIE